MLSDPRVKPNGLPNVEAMPLWSADVTNDIHIATWFSKEGVTPRNKQLQQSVGFSGYIEARLGKVLTNLCPVDCFDEMVLETLFSKISSLAQEGSQLPQSLQCVFCS